MNFIKVNYDLVIQAEFGITYAPLSLDSSPIPIGCISSTSGKATLDKIEKVQALIASLKAKHEIIGLGTDGDN